MLNAKVSAAYLSATTIVDKLCRYWLPIQSLERLYRHRQVMSLCRLYQLTKPFGFKLWTALFLCKTIQHSPVRFTFRHRLLLMTQKWQKYYAARNWFKLPKWNSTQIIWLTYSLCDTGLAIRAVTASPVGSSLPSRRRNRAARQFTSISIPSN